MNQLHSTTSQKTAVSIMAAVFWDFRSHKRRIHVLQFFGFFDDTENAELPEQKVHRRYKFLLSYGTCAALPLVWCGV
jgi:phosphatidylserine/phosphatidylglycerophosphate/cardiolipin synthase-like enzyme